MLFQHQAQSDQRINSFWRLVRVDLTHSRTKLLLQRPQQMLLIAHNDQGGKQWVLPYRIHKPVTLEVLLADSLFKLVKVLVTIAQDKVTQALDEGVLVSVLVLLLRNVNKEEKSRYQSSDASPVRKRSPIGK